jgi:hypothetical protein
MGTSWEYITCTCPRCGQGFLSKRGAFSASEQLQDTRYKLCVVCQIREDERREQEEKARREEEPKARSRELGADAGKPESLRAALNRLKEAAKQK